MTNKPSYPISFSCAVYNESKIIVKQLIILKNELTNRYGKNNFEIIIVNNGSSDLTPGRIKKIQSLARYYSISTKGHGLAFKKAIEVAKYDHIILSAIDLPFGFSDVDQLLPIWNKYDLIYGSKAHSKSYINVPFSRKIASTIFRYIMHLLFAVNIHDTQGSVFLRKKKITPLLKFCTAHNAFFTAQLAIYAQLHSLRMTEIPVNMRKRTNRKSKYNVIFDGTLLLQTMINEYIKIHLHKSILFKTSRV